MRETLKKAISILLVSVVGMSILAGCGSGNEAKVAADATSIANDLRNKITYDDDIAEMDLDTASMFIDLSDVDIVKSVIYESSGATAEEIIVLECASADDAAKAITAFKTRVSEQKSSFEDYVPEELPKLSSAVIAQSGTFAILSVSGDADTAKSIISEYLK